MNNHSRLAVAMPALTVYADLRWPAKTGIGNVMTACMERAPDEINIVPLTINSGLGSPWSPFVIKRALDDEEDDGVFWSPGFVPPAFSKRPTVVTVHDLTHLHFYSRLHRAYYDVLFRRMYRRCTAVICVSDYTRNEFLAWSGMPHTKVHVVHNGVDPAYARNDEVLESEDPYVLYPGNRRNYKNLERLFTAYARSSLPAKGIHLMLTGKPDAALKELAHALGISWRLRFAGDVPDAMMPKLYRGALFVAFVSLYEGFGLPILEAMMSRVPVLTSNVSAMPEVAGNAALTVDPRSVADITKAMNRLAEDRVLREELIECGRERAMRFSWDRSADALWTIVEQASLVRKQ
ncbi:glycosyl transferase, group 1 [Caballeronia udeis]|uniref:Glycosyl transferase, group 1 n=1 Tax=Caballeronia udeis TaxID=1232866 RepID=A0A158J9C8_9BURK|nr:glycosyltransferase family 1 protein [Caballeronia udeis]SAL65039.1 glycosyl transferase, group 1 [Caballeronia udeis]